MQFAGFDVETWGTDPAYALQPFRARSGDAWLTAAVFKADGFVGFRALNSPTLKAKLRVCLHWAAKNNVTIVGWNTPFDVAWLIALGLRDEVFACKWLDAMLLYKHNTQHPTFESYCPEIKDISYSLKAAVRKYLPHHANYEKDIEFGTTDYAKLQKLLEYNEKDVDRTLELAMLFWKQLTDKQKRAALIEAASIPLMADAMVEGIAGDSQAAVKLSDKLLEDSNVAYTTLKFQNPEDITPEVLASPVQLRDLVFGKWGLPFVTLTDKGAASTDREALTYLSTIDERARLLNTYREAKNNGTKFADGMLQSLYYNRDGRVRPQPRLYGTYTGRLTYSSTQGRGKAEVQTGIALHQWKRDPEFRKLIRAPDGYTLFEFDFAGQEFRWMAVAANDPVMISLCQPGEDAHSYMAASIRGVDYRTLVERVKSGDKSAKNDRQLGKVANLSLQYRTSAKRLQSVAAVQYGIKLLPTEADVIHTTYQRTYTQVPKYWNQQKYKANTQEYIENLLGRRVQFLPKHRRDPDYEWSYTSTSINYPIQSMGAEQKLLALMVARNVLPKFDARFYYELHDGLFFIVPDDRADEFGPHMKELLSNLPYEKAWGLDLPVQFPVDGKRGPNWGELREFS